MAGYEVAYAVALGCAASAFSPDVVRTALVERLCGFG
jgi:hypothetical protein